MKKAQKLKFKFSRKAFSYLIPFLLFVAGMYLFPIRVMETDFSKIPGDMGDARFNNYILEHGHKFLTGKLDNYWDAPFMYPYKNVIAFSDNLLGTLPIYSLFRIGGADRETAFQFWILTLFALNFIFCFWALKKWSGEILLSGVGAYIFAFSLFNLGQLGHAQVFPRFIIPFVFFCSWKFLSEKKIKFFLLAALGIVYQFYCGIYLGFLLIYVLVFFTIAYFIIYRDWDFFKQFLKAKRSLIFFGIVVSAGGLIVPLMIPYIEISMVTGMRQFGEVVDSIPRLRSYFFASSASYFWNFLYGINAYKFPAWWNHCLFPGLLPWIGIIAIPFAVFFKKGQIEEKRFITFILIGFLLTFIFCLNINGVTLYYIFFKIPGFGSMKSIDRVINVEIIFFVLGFVFVFCHLARTRKIIRSLFWGIPLFIILDNYFEPQPWTLGRFEKEETKKRTDEFKACIESQYDTSFAAVSYLPVNIVGNETVKNYSSLVEINLTMMLAAQELSIPCINAYTGSLPGNFVQFFFRPDKEHLDNWLEYNSLENKRILYIDDICKKEISRQEINLKTSDGKFVSCDESREKKLFGNRDKAGLWERFLLIEFEGGDCALLSKSGFFISSDSDCIVSANSMEIKNNNFLTLIVHNGNTFSFKTENNKYFKVDYHSRQIFANADSINDNSKFAFSEVYFSFKKEISKSFVNLIASNGKFVSADESLGNTLIANRDIASTWESFEIFMHENNQCTMRSGSGFFFTINPEDNFEVSAVKETVGDQEIFTMVKLGDEFFAFKAMNKKFLSVDEKNHRIFASGFQIGENEKFRILFKEKLIHD